jgi:hypothetical protein
MMASVSIKCWKFATKSSTPSRTPIKTGNEIMVIAACREPTSAPYFHHRQVVDRKVIPLIRDFSLQTPQGVYIYHNQITLNICSDTAWLYAHIHTYMQVNIHTYSKCLSLIKIVLLSPLADCVDSLCVSSGRAFSAAHLTGTSCSSCCHNLIVKKTWCSHMVALVDGWPTTWT